MSDTSSECYETASDGNSPTSFTKPSRRTTAYMSVLEDDPYYNMNHPRRGKALIFNFDKEIPSLDLDARLGSAKDRDDLAKCLEGLEFAVEKYDNLKYKQFDKTLKKVRKEDHTEADCLVVVIMTHGEKNRICMADGIQIPVNQVWENFTANNCPTLAGKPKIFIIQACRGERHDMGTTLAAAKPKGVVPLSGPSVSDETDCNRVSYAIPDAADIIVAFSCPMGYRAWRHPEQGSWFIQSIVEVFNEFAYQDDGEDLLAMLTRVKRKVALKYESSTHDANSTNTKQVPFIADTLIRTLIFRPKKDYNGGSNSLSTVPLLEGEIINIHGRDEERSMDMELELGLITTIETQVAGLML